MGVGEKAAGREMGGATVTRLRAPGISILVRKARRDRNNGKADPIMFADLVGKDRNGNAVSYGPGVIGETGTALEFAVIAGGWAGYVLRMWTETLGGEKTDSILGYHGALHVEQESYWHETRADAFDDNQLGTSRREILLLSPEEYAAATGDTWQRHHVVRASAGAIADYGPLSNPKDRRTAKPTPSFADMVPPDNDAPARRAIAHAAARRGPSAEAAAGGDVTLLGRGGGLAPGDEVGRNPPKTMPDTWGISRELPPHEMKFRVFVADHAEFLKIQTRSRRYATDLGDLE